MKKIYIIILGSCIVLILLISITVLVSKKNAENGTVSKLFPNLFPTSIPIKPGSDFEDYQHTKHKSSEFDDTSLPTTAPINSFNLLLIGKAIPDNLVPMQENKDAQGNELSPDGLSSTKLEDTDLIVTDVNNINKVQRIKSAPNIRQSSFAWLSNDLLLYIQKESSPQQIDKIYIVERTSGEETYLLGSFPIPKRLNLGVKPLIFNSGQEILLIDNDNQYWELSIR